MSIVEGSIVRAGPCIIVPGWSDTNGIRAGLNQYVIVYDYGGLFIDDDVMIEDFCSIFATNHCIDRTDIPIRQKAMVTKGGSQMKTMFGWAHIVLSSTALQSHPAVSSQPELWLSDFAPFSTVGGVPAKVINMREDNA